MNQPRGCGVSPCTHLGPCEGPGDLPLPDLISRVSTLTRPRQQHLHCFNRGCAISWETGSRSGSAFLLELRFFSRLANT